MYEQEKKRSIHLMILVCNTLFTVALLFGAFFFQLEMWTAVIFTIGLVVSWMLHITERTPESVRLWFYIITALLAFSYYGVYELGLFDLAPLAIMLIFICTVTEERVFVRLCAITYCPTMLYKIWITYGDSRSVPTGEIVRIAFHFILILVGERLAEIVLQRRNMEAEKTAEKITQLEEANRSVEDFLANVSHELRTPINAVTGITSVMLKNENDPDKRKDVVAIRMAGNRLFNQVENILDYTEIDAGRVIVSEESYMLSSLINDIIAEYRLDKSDNKLELIFDLEAGMPLTLLGDGRKIKKIIMHLIDNAAKFTKEGGIYVRVYAMHKSYGINLCIKVSDTGAGIAEEELGKITERFFQANGGRNRKTGGLGLGLAIVYGMVASMDGFIQMESVEGDGTTVSVSIPQKVADPTPSMQLVNRENVCIGLYLRPEKYEIPAVRDYYNTAVSHMVKELDVMVHRVFDLEELKKLTAKYQLTHLIIGKEEYDESSDYYEDMDQSVEIIVVADDNFRPMKNSRVIFVRKPFFSLPIVNVLNAQSDSDAEGENVIWPGIRVLVVDDEPMNLMVAEGIFQSYQMIVTTAESGKEAIELCKKETFDLVFLDHMMPEMDGVETLKILRKTQTDTSKVNTVIAFTANAVSGAREMFLREGFDEFISKPIEEQELKRLLRKVLPEDAAVYCEENTVTPDQADKEQPKIQQTVPENGMRDKLAGLGTRGFDTKAGLQYARNDYEFYEKLLVMFAKDSEGKILNLDKSLYEENSENYRTYVHALKSSSRMIGANDLSEMALKAEEAAKRQETDYLRANHEKLIDHYRETVRHIVDALNLPQTEHIEEKPAADTEITKEELLSRLAGLCDGLKTFEVDIVESLLEELQVFAYRGKSVYGLLREVRQDVEDFELSAAAEKTETLIGSVEGGEV